MLFVKFLFILLLSIFVYGNRDEKRIIDIDYYGRGLLRHTRVDMNCELELHKQYCRFKCSRSHAVCIEGNCYCVKGNTTGLLPSRQLHEPEDLPSRETKEEDIFLNRHPSLNYKPKKSNSRTIRRHHIAHFCVDLDEARKCIRKCMPQGKPAFCGKDHVCYCGHKYQTPGNKFKKTNVSAQYAQFKDLYDKYFGKVEATEEVDDNNMDDNIIVAADSKEGKKKIVAPSQHHDTGDEIEPGTIEIGTDDEKASSVATDAPVDGQPIKTSKESDGTENQDKTDADNQETTPNVEIEGEQTGETNTTKLKKRILRHRFINI